MLWILISYPLSAFTSISLSSVSCPMGELDANESYYWSSVEPLTAWIGVGRNNGGNEDGLHALNTHFYHAIDFFEEDFLTKITHFIAFHRWIGFWLQDYGAWKRKGLKIVWTSPPVYLGRHLTVFIKILQAFSLCFLNTANYQKLKVGVAMEWGYYWQ